MGNLNLDTSERLFLIKVLSKCPEAKAAKLVKRIERSLKKIKPRSAKNKGSSWEKECCEMISRVTDVPYVQSDDNCDIHAREMGLNGVDCIVRGKARELFPFDVECKNCTKLSIPDWVKQAESNCTELDNWLLLIKSQILPMKKIVVLSFSRFEELMKKYNGVK